MNKNVISPKFGKGIVKEINGGKAIIEFQNETKELLVKFAGLTYENGEKVEVKVEVVKVEVEKVERKKIVITIDDLKEYKGLIIWNIKYASYGFNLIKDVMESMLNDVNSGKVKAKTKRGIKGTLTRLARTTALSIAEDTLRENLGLSALVNYRENTDLQRFQQYRLDKLS